jgi:hypothetical protein
MYLSISSHENKSSNRLAIESVILNIASIFYYFSHAFSFFIYYISSSIYRQQTKQSIVKITALYTNRSSVQTNSQIN